jgi:hypothetical protein
MTTLVHQMLSEVRFGNLHTNHNVGIIPLMRESKPPFDFTLLNDALDRHLITIRELSEGGSVPELKVVNESEIHVLLLDGQEIKGAKQHRILNTSLLIEPRSETVIPVSCSERGRWSYRSPSFHRSNSWMRLKSRARKARFVSGSLKRGLGFRSNQSEVWSDIEELHRQSGTSEKSSTRAMSDVFDERKNDLEKQLEALACQPGQTGSVVFIDGEVVGLDLLATEAAYREVHSHLLKSYLIDALPVRSEMLNGVSAEKATAFLQESLTCTESSFKSAGGGFDHRLEGAGVVGSALVYQNTVVHLSLFKNVE